MKSFFKLIFLLLIGFTSQAQKHLTWDDLMDVKFNEEYHNDLGAYVMIPDFGPQVTKFEDKVVEITGYVIPIDIENNDYVLSANPFASCFFCGNSGPESVIQLKLTAMGSFNTDDYITFRGKLKLNATDVYSLNYILENAEEALD